MRILTLDFETYYAKDYTLSKLTNEQYIRDPRFQVIMVGLKMNDNPAFWVPLPQIRDIFAKIPWHETAVLSHHAHFDMAILSWIYGIRPAFICDTLPMFRALYPHESASLANMCKVLGVPEKGHEVTNAIGLRWEHFSKDALFRYGSYCVNDVEIERMCFDIMKRQFPASELKLIDSTTRLFTEPILELNPQVLQEAYNDEKQRLFTCFVKAMPELTFEARDAILNDDIGAWRKLKTPLSSNPQFAELLLNMGVDPPKKLSPAAVKKGIANPDVDMDPPIGLLTKASKAEIETMKRVMGVDAHPLEKWTYAFSKSDEHFKHLLQHPDEDVVALVEARLGVKSTIKETRAKAFIGVASRGTFPIYLKYYGAATGRDGGGDRLNPQNLNRSCPHCNGDGCPKCHDTGVSPLRRAIEAPEGHVIVVRDLSAIEARVNFWLAGQEDKVEAYRNGEDLYCKAASEVFGKLVTKKDKDERFLGKAQILGCGYGLGYKKFQGMLRIGMLGNAGMLLGQDIATALGVSGEVYGAKNTAYLQETMPPGVAYEQHALHCACSEQIIKLFRDNNPMVTKMWRTMQGCLEIMYSGGSGQVLKNGVIGYCPEGFILPNGMLIRYPELRQKVHGRSVEYDILKNKRKGERGKVYGGLCTENVTQGTSRVILTDAWLKMLDAGLKPVHRVHDEILVIAKESEAERTYDLMGKIMATPPSWAPDLPLASEGGWAKQYIK